MMGLAPRVRPGSDCEWVILPPHPARDRFAAEAKIAPLLAQLLLLRGVHAVDQVEPFLAPDFRLLLPPECLPGAVEAAERLARAVRQHRRIVIYGDYDVDGITATAILWHVLRAAQADVHYYIPSRLEEGYGLNSGALERLAAAGASVVITVDCGITAREEAARARQLGLELLITDHHQPGPSGDLPDAAAVVHPSACGPSPNPNLSGAGVALKVAWALARALSGGARVSDAYRETLLDATALAALGLIADVVPLLGENRVIASNGLRRLPYVRQPGIAALLRVARLAKKANYDDYDVGFALAPRLNAIGRMGHARQAVEMLTCADAARAREIAQLLDGENRRRQDLERQIAREAESLVISKGFDRESQRGIVLASPAWHAGVIGIVAARLVERFHRPTVLIALEEDEGQGSGRSVRHFPLHEALGVCAPHLVRFGGHAMAAGLRVRADRIDAFTEAFLAEAARRLTPADLRARLYLDDEILLSDLTIDVAEAIQALAPFGTNNPRPRLATSVVELVEDPRPVGSNGAHLMLKVRQNGTYRRAIYFGGGDQATPIAEERRLRLAFEPLVNKYNGRRTVELRVIDWKPAVGGA